DLSACSRRSNVATQHPCTPPRAVRIRNRHCSPVDLECDPALDQMGNLIAINQETIHSLGGFYCRAGKHAIGDHRAMVAAVEDSARYGLLNGGVAHRSRISLDLNRGSARST